LTDMPGSEGGQSGKLARPGRFDKLSPTRWSALLALAICMKRNSTAYRLILLFGTVIGLAGAAYLAWHLFRKPNLADAVTAGQAAYDRGVQALDARDGAGATAAFSEAISKADEVLSRLDSLQATKKLNADDAARAELIRSDAYWLRARATRDRAYAAGLVAQQPLPDVLDTTTRERYRTYLAIPNAAERDRALTDLDQALNRAPDHPDILLEVLRNRLSVDPPQWGEIAALAQHILAHAPEDARANYLLARIEFEQFDEKNSPTPPDKRDPARVLRARQYLAKAKKDPKQPIWRTLDLDVRISQWLIARPEIRGDGFDSGAEAARLRKVLFDPKDGVLARAAAGVEFDVLSRFDVAGLIDLHRRAVDVAAEDAGSGAGPGAGRLLDTMRAFLAIVRTMRKLPAAKGMGPDLVQDLTDTAAATRSVAVRVAPDGWTAFRNELEDFCRSEAAVDTGATAADRLAELRLADADDAAAAGHPDEVAAAEAKALDWLVVAARRPDASPGVRADTLGRILELKAARGVDLASWAAELEALAALTLPRAVAARAFFSGVHDVREGRLQEAYGLFGQAAAITDGGSYKLRAFAALPGLALVLGRLPDAINFGRDLDRGWTEFASLDRLGRDWVATQVNGREEAAAIAIIAQYRTAQARVERERKEQPEKEPAADLTKGTERSAEAALAKLPAKAAPALPARLARLEFLVTAGRPPDDVRATAAALRRDYRTVPAAILRAEVPATDPDRRRAEDDRAREAAKSNRLFWAEWLISTGRSAEAAKVVAEMSGFEGPALGRLLGSADPVAGAALVRALEADKDPSLVTAERAEFQKLGAAVRALSAGDSTAAAKAFHSVAEVPVLKGAAAAGIRAAAEQPKK
jgi:hypothetical protein